MIKRLICFVLKTGKEIKYLFEFRKLPAVTLFCINCGKNIPILPKMIKQNCVYCGYEHFPEIAVCGKEEIYIFAGGYIRYFLTKLKKNIIESIPKFNIYIWKRFFCLQIDNRSPRDRCYGHPSDVCECRLCHIEFRFLFIYIQKTIGIHFCNLCFFPNNKFFKQFKWKGNK